MIRVLFSLLLLAVIAAACPSLADDQPSELKADEAYGVLHAEERVIDLPADQWRGSTGSEQPRRLPCCLRAIRPFTVGRMDGVAVFRPNSVWRSRKDRR